MCLVKPSFVLFRAFRVAVLSLTAEADWSAFLNESRSLNSQEQSLRTRLAGLSGEVSQCLEQLNQISSQKNSLVSVGPSAVVFPTSRIHC